MKKVLKFSIFAVLLLTTLLFPNTASAVCPICTVAVGAGLGLSRWLGIDDAVSSIWIGGLILSSSFWLTDWLKKKKIKALEKPFFAKEVDAYLDEKTLKQYSSIAVNAAVIILMYVAVLIPLKMSKIIGHPYNTIIGVDKILFGTALGSIMFLIGMGIDKKIRQIKGKQLFQYQKVFFPVVSLVITSFLLYYYGGYLY